MACRQDITHQLLVSVWKIRDYAACIRSAAQAVAAMRDGLRPTDQIRETQRRVNVFRPERYGADRGGRGGARGADTTGHASKPSNATTAMNTATKTGVVTEFARVT